MLPFSPVVVVTTKWAPGVQQAQPGGPSPYRPQIRLPHPRSQLPTAC